VVADSLVEAGGQPDAIGQLPTSIAAKNLPLACTPASFLHLTVLMELQAALLARLMQLGNELGRDRTAIASFQHLLAAPVPSTVQHEKVLR